jgi:hypothetical protein
MRRMKRDDRGAVAILVVLLTPIMLIGISLAADAGAIAFQKNRAQSTSDAIAIAAAQNCASGKPSGAVGVAPVPGKQATTQNVTLPACGAGQITVTTTQPVHFTFVPTPGGTQVSKSGTAKWQQLRSGVIFPFAFSSCAFGGSTAVGTHVLLYANGVNCGPAPGQNSNSKGFIQGGCQLTSVGGTLTDANGNSFIGTNCQSGNLDDFLNSTGDPLKDVLIPVWSQANGGVYTISSILRFRLLGWSANGSRVGGEMTGRCTVPGLTPVVGNANSPCASGIVEAYGATQGGTTGQPCDGNTLSACFVFLAS